MKMIPLGMGSGGGIVNVFAATVLPQDVDERSIVIISDMEAGNISLQTTAPQNPASGDVWVEIGNTSPNMIALDGSVELQLIAASAYADGSWQRREAYYAFCNEWVQFSVDSREITIMGYEWDYGNPSPLLTRLGAAAGLTATGSVGAVAGYSDFDSMHIFRDIRRCNLSPSGIVNAYEGDSAFAYTGTNGDVMVEIPKFWYKRENDTAAQKLRFQIADKEVAGFDIFPWFLRPDGTIRGKAYIGAYEMGAGYASKSGVAPLTNLTRGAFRTGAKAKGAGWSLQDLSARIAITELMRIEFATHNIQAAIGRGQCDANSSALATGRTNSIAGHSGREAGTDGKTSVAWRGIENPYGNVWEWVDGLNINNGALYFCTDQTKFADDTATNYTLLGFTIPTNLTNSYGSALGFDANNPWAAIPSAFAGASETTYLTDACSSSTAWRAAHLGGSYASGGICGLSAWHWGDPASHSYASIGSRLMYLP